MLGFRWPVEKKIHNTRLQTKDWTCTVQLPNQDIKKLVLPNQDIFNLYVNSFQKFTFHWVIKILARRKYFCSSVTNVRTCEPEPQAASLFTVHCGYFSFFRLPRFQMKKEKWDNVHNICLIGSYKKRGTLHHLTCHATVQQHMKTAIFQPEVVWKSPFLFLPTGIFWINFASFSR